MTWAKELCFLLLCFVLSSTGLALLPASSQTRSLAPADYSFSFVVFGDSQSGNQVFDRLISRVNQEKDLAFAVHLGDTIQYGGGETHADYLKHEAKLKLKVYHVPGNHDLAGQGDISFRKLLGPYYYSFDYKNSHFIILNNAFAESFTARQFTWLKKDLAATKKKHIFIFMHRPVFDPSEIFTGYVMSGREVTEELMRLFDKYKVDYVFAGHLHCYAKEKRGTVYIVSGGAGGRLHLPREWGGFHHYVKISVAGDKVSDEVIEVND